MDRVFFCGSCRKFFFYDCDEMTYFGKCKHCESRTTITCNLSKENYDNYTDDEKEHFKRSMKEKYANTEQVVEGQKKILAKRKEEEAERLREIDSIKVTTGDLKRDYEILMPIYYQIGSRGNKLLNKMQEYAVQIATLMGEQVISSATLATGDILREVFVEQSVGEYLFEVAFYIATQELKKKAYALGADAVICMRQDVDIETERLNNFVLQMYGTAVKFI